MTIDRIDFNGNYEPSNCRWITQSEQVNNSRHNRYITIDGITKTVTQWAVEKGIKKGTAIMRLHRNWDAERLFEKTRKRGK